MDSLSILIKSILQAPSDAEINKVKTELENKLKNVNINTSGKGIKILDDKEIDIYVQKMQNQLSRLQIGKGKVFENAGVQEELNKFTQSLELFKNKGAISTKEVGLQFDNLKTKVAQVSGEFKNVNKDGYAFTDMITLAAKKLIIWKVAGDAIFAVIRLLKQIPDIVSKIDESLTEVNKVLDLSVLQMKSLAEEATNLGIAYGKTTVEILNSIGSFAKAGLDQETSKQFASLAALLSNVGNISTEVAEKTLIMANAGYQLGNDYKTLNGLISQFNELANRNAIEVDTLSEAWQVSASVAKQAKLNIEDYNAIITVAGSTSQRSGREIGNALRTWLMRLQGVTDGTDTLEEDVSKVDKVLGELGIQLRKTPTEFRPAMEVITEIAAKYRELGEAGETVKQSELLESLAGKYRANIVAGVLSNFDDISKALDDQTNSFMSAEKENARYMDSIKARTQALQAQWELFASKTLDSSVIKGIVEFGRVLVQVLDSGFVRFIGTTALLTAGIYGLGIGIKALGKSTIGTALGVAALELAQKGLLVVTKDLWIVLSASPLFWITAAVVAVQGLVWVFDALNVTVEEQKQKVEDAQQAYNKTKTEIQSLNTELETTKQRIDELNAKDKPSIVEDNELEKLQLTNEELKLRLALLKEQAEYDGQQVVGEQSKLYEQKYGKYDISSDKIKQVYSSDTEQLYGGYDYNDKFIVPINAEKEDISSLIAIYKLLTEEKKKALNAGDIKRADGYSGAIETIKESLNETALEFLNFKDAFSSVEYLTPEQRKTLNEITMGLDFIINDIFPELEDAKFPLPDDTGSFYDYSKNIEKSQEALDNFSKSAKTLSSVWKTINDGEKISADTMISLIQSYPEYTSQILKANESKESGIKLVNILWEIERNRNIDAIEGEKELLEVRLANLQALTKSVPLSQIGATYQEIYKAQKLIDDANLSIKALEGWKPSDFAGSGNNKNHIPHLLHIPPSSEESALKALYDAQEISLEIYIQRLIALEKEKYSEYSKLSAQELENALRSRNENVAKKASEYLSLRGTIQGLQSDQITLSFAETEDSLKSLDNELSKLGNINTLEEKAQQSEIWKNKLRLVVDEIFRIEQALQNSTLSSSQIQLLENKKTELEILRASLTDDLSQNLTQSNESKLDAIEAVESKIIEIIKKRYEEESKEREKAYNQEKKDLQDSLDAYRDYIQGRIDALDKLNETEDYNKQVQEQSQKILDIQSEIDKYSLAANSGDLDAQNRVTELLKEQTDERNSLAEMQTDRERKLQKQSLQEQLKNYENYTKKQEDLLDEEYNTYRENLEKMTTDVALYTEAQKIMANSTFEELTSMYLTFENNFGSGMSLLGNIIENEFIQKLQTAKTALSELNSLTGGKMQESTNAEIEQAKERIGQLQTLWNQTDNENLRRKYNEEAERLRKKYGLSFADLRGYRARYLHGGIDTVGGLNYLDGKPNAVETIFNATQGKKLFDFVNNLPHSIINVVKPNLQSFSALAGSGMNNNFVFNVAGNVDKAVANDIVEQVIKRQRIEFNKMGIFK